MHARFVPVARETGSEESGVSVEESEEPLNTWSILQDEGILSANTYRWYQFTIASWAATSVLAVLSAGFLYLALFPHATWKTIYGKQVSQTLCASGSMAILLWIVMQFGAARVLTSSAVGEAAQMCGSKTKRKMSELHPFGINAGYVGDCTLSAMLGVLLFGSCYVAGVLVVDRVWHAPEVSITILLIATGSSGFCFHQGVAFTLELIKSMSIIMVETRAEQVRSFPITTAPLNEGFWEQALDDYKNMDKMLENLWSDARVLFIAWFCHWMLVGNVSLVICIFAMKMEDWKTQVCCVGSIISSLTMILRELWVLAKITRSCNSTCHRDNSIFSLASEKSRNQMTEQQRKDHWFFLHSVAMSPAGVQIFTLVDAALVIRIAVPLLTAVSSFASYVLATLRISD